MTLIELLSPRDLVQSPAFSHVAIVPPGATQIYVGGQNAVDADGNLVGGDDIVAQVERVMANLETALEYGGASMTDLISVTILLVDGTDLSAVAAVVR
jgi:enamine deaminase RidA (YjgF/YER057c/UK114 family)